MGDKKGLILLSGGIDSAVTLAWAVAQGYDMHAIFFDYGQPAAEQEVRFANLVNTRCGGTAFHSFKLGQDIFGFPDQDNFEYPVRNLVLISAAAAIAVNRNRPHVFVGINSSAGSESEGVEYPDCSPDFVEAAEVALKFCSADLELHAPLLRVTKTGVLGLAATFGIDLSNTFSCVIPGDDGEPCGGCVSCVERSAALEKHASD